MRLALGGAIANITSGALESDINFKTKSNDELINQTVGEEVKLSSLDPVYLQKTDRAPSAIEIEFENSDPEYSD